MEGPVAVHAATSAANRDGVSLAEAMDDLRVSNYRHRLQPGGLGQAVGVEKGEVLSACLVEEGHYHGE
jgi:hypothetical protein